ERERVRVQVGEMVDAELERPLYRDQPLAGRDLVHDRPQQRGLPRVRGPGDHEILPRGGRRGQEGRHRGTDGPVAGQVAQEYLAEPGTADGHRGPDDYIHDRRQPRSIREADVELRVGRVERPAGQARVGGQRLDQLNEFLVAVRDRVGQYLPAVGAGQEHPVAPVDVDVLDLRVVQQRLEPAHSEQRSMDGGGELFLLLGTGRGPARGDLGPRVLLQHTGDEGAGELPLVLTGHRR